MQSPILLIGPKSSSATLARALNRNLNVTCTWVGSARCALAVLRNDEFALILLDKKTAAADRSISEMLFQGAGAVQVIEVNLARLNVSQILLQVRTALNRRLDYQWHAFETARKHLAAELHSDISALVTESNVVLQSASRLEAARIRRLVRLAGQIRNKFEAA